MAKARHNLRSATPRALACLTLMTAAIAVCSPASAQTAPTSLDRLKIEVRARVLYDSNVAGGNQTFAAERGVSTSDTLYAPGVTVVGNLPIGRQALFLTASADLQRYARNKQLNGDNLNFASGLRGRFGPCGEAVTLGYTRQLTPASELLIPIPKNIATQKYVDGSVTCSRGHLIGGLQSRYTDLTNSAHNAGLVDFHSTTVAANAGYAGETLGALTLLAQYTDVKYDVPPGITTIQASGFESTEVGVRYFRRIGLRLSGTADLTYDHTKSKLQSSPLLVNPKTEFTGWSADVLMAYRVSSRTGLELLYARHVQPAEVADVGFDLTETFRLSGSHQLGRNMQISGGASRTHTDYNRAQLGLLNLGSDTVDTFFATASVAVGRHLRVSIDGQHLDRRSDQPLFSYQSDRVGITVAGEF